MDPLDDHGLAEARGLAKDVRDHRPKVIFTSDIRRTAQTAEAIADAIPYHIQTVTLPDLRSWNVGQLTGRPVSEIKDELERIMRNGQEPAPGGESYNDFAGRVVNVFAKLDEFARKLGLPIAVVTHSRVIRSVKELCTTGIRGLFQLAVKEVLMRDREALQPGGHTVIAWNGRQWMWGQDRIHTAPWQAGASAPKADTRESKTT